MYLIYYKTTDGSRTWIKSEDHNIKQSLHKIYIEPDTDKNEVYYEKIKDWEQYTEG